MVHSDDETTSNRCLLDLGNGPPLFNPFETNDSSNAADAGTAQVHSLSLKVPVFDSKNPEMWFTWLESGFVTSRVTSETTKYHHTVTALGIGVMARISGFFKRPLQERANPYSELKEAILKHFKESTADSLNSLFMGLSLGNRRPSELLARMIDAADGNIADKLVESLWLARLPEVLRPTVSAFAGGLPEKGEYADKLMDSFGFQFSQNPFHTAQVTSFQPAHHVPPPAVVAAAIDPVRRMEEMFSRFEERLAICERKSRERNSNHQRGRSKSRNQSRGGMCHYHHRFGNRAKKCIGQCSFVPKNE